MDKDVADKIDEIEGQLLAQEHRTFAILGNWFIGYGNRSDKCKSGIKWSLITLVLGWFTPAAPVASAGAGFATILTLVALQMQCSQIQEAKKQNSLLAEQLRITTATAFSNRIDSLQTELFALESGQEISEKLRIEVVTWSQSLKPIRNLDNDRKLSRERGRLLIALVNSPANTESVFIGQNVANFSNADLTNAQFGKESPMLAHAILQDAALDGANLKNADLHEAHLPRATLKEAILIGTNLRDADFTGADLTKADLRDADLRDVIIPGADFTSARLENSIVNDANWLEDQRKSKAPPRGIDWYAWRIEADAAGTFRLKPKK